MRGCHSQENRIVTINWVFPRVYAPASGWRVRTAVTLTPPARLRARTAASAPKAQPTAPRALDRDTARALAEAGYMPLQRYIELFGNEGAGEGEV
jgi:hypothetical protein